MWGSVRPSTAPIGVEEGVPVRLLYSSALAVHTSMTDNITHHKFLLKLQKFRCIPTSALGSETVVYQLTFGRSGHIGLQVYACSREHAVGDCVRI